MAERDLDLVVVGDVNLDLVLRGGDVVPTFGQHEQIVDSAELVLGGSGAIVAAGAARLGLRVALAGCVGDDALGRIAVDALREHGVDASATRVDPLLGTGITVGLVLAEDRAMLTAPGALAGLRGDGVPDALLARARHVHMSSPFLQAGLAPHLAALAGRARAAGASTSLDPGWDPRDEWTPVRDALGAFDVLLPNEQEALRLAGRDDGDVEAAALALAARGPLVVVKLGPEGALAAAGSDVIRVRAPATDAIDATGAGDSFDAGFLTARLEPSTLLKGSDPLEGLEPSTRLKGSDPLEGLRLKGSDPLEGLRRALALGCACGALSTRAAGGTAAQPQRAEARALAGSLA